MANNIGFEFSRNVNRALKDKQLRKNFKFAMGNFILKRQQIFPDKEQTEKLRDLGDAIKRRALNKIAATTRTA